MNNLWKTLCYRLSSNNSAWKSSHSLRQFVSSVMCDIFVRAVVLNIALFRCRMKPPNIIIYAHHTAIFSIKPPPICNKCVGKFASVILLKNALKIDRTLHHWTLQFTENYLQHNPLIKNELTFENRFLQTLDLSLSAL